MLEQPRPVGPVLESPVLGRRDAGADEAPGLAGLVDRRDQASSLSRTRCSSRKARALAIAVPACDTKQREHLFVPGREL
ncbi:MAG: hypothetical protein OXK74_18565 [Gemmatimonadota bacterium]|nr:hypothetical protein [Gemmatimonadota bacterium]